MVSKRLPVKLTANFEANLTAIKAFWAGEKAPQSYDRLLDNILETLLPNFEQFPKLGGAFLAHDVQSVEAQALVERLNTRIGHGEIGEYLTDDYLILYASVGEAIYLLSIKRHRELSFDFEGYWPK